MNFTLKKPASLLCFILCIVLLVSLIGCGKNTAKDGDTGFQATKLGKIKVLHVMSYHSPWEWTDTQLKGFQDQLKDLDVEYNIFQMDTKRQSTEEWKIKVGEEAAALVESWKPNLVFTNDDNAQKYFAINFVNNPIPFVFAAVNSDPETYGYAGSSNMCGIQEHEHFVPSVRLMQKIVPTLKKIAVITDNDPSWPVMIKRMKEKAATQLTDIQVVAWDTLDTFAEYKQKVKEYQKTVDALCYLGVHTFKDEKGQNVLQQDVGKWTVENSNLPDFSFWADRIPKGTLASVTVNGYEQGQDAGKMARAILVEGKTPASLGFSPTLKGQPVISLARAKQLGLNIDADTLLSVEIIERYEWDQK
jgi:ABC-type uncharacterized transport system substrate-binding protein